jgi:hypothetical protein
MNDRILPRAAAMSTLLNTLQTEGNDFRNP